jgi:uncharacterized membrane protein YeaQ/YmgE (transglycosylase-associated protein family)
MKRGTKLVVAVAVLSQSLLWAGEPRQLQLKWSELGPRVEGRRVALVVTGGTYIEGKVQRVVPDGVWLRISKTSDHQAQPKGSHLIPRPSVSTMQVTEYRWLGRLLVTTAAVGAVAGLVAAANPDVSEGPGIVAIPVIGAAGIIGAAVGGYHAGKRLDKRVIEIRIVTEAPTSYPPPSPSRCAPPGF